MRVARVSRDKMYQICKNFHYILFPGFNLDFRFNLLISFLFYHLGKLEKEKPNHSDCLATIFIHKSDHEVSKSQSKLKRYQSAVKRSDECPDSGSKIQNKCCMNVLRKYTSCNIVNVNKLNVVDNIGASKFVSFASTISEIDFELADLSVQDATSIPVTSSTPMQKGKNLQLT